MLEPHVQYEDFTTAGETKADESLLVRFFVKEREDKARTASEGRPIFKDEEYVEIRAVGRRDPLACRPATLQDKQRFNRHYEAFKQRIELPESGTPLSEWPQISRSQVEELAFMNVKTVEQLADISDTHATQFRGGFMLKKRAKEFLEHSDRTKLIAEKEALETRVADLESKLEMLLSGQTTQVPQEPVADLSSELDTEQTVEEPATPRKRRQRRAKAE